MSARWGDPQPSRLPALLETASHSVTALLLAIMLACALGLAVTL